MVTPVDFLRPNFSVHPERHEPDQDTIEMYPAANALIQADWVLFDFDDTLVDHDPRAQYWTALHAIALEHANDETFQLAQFVDNYQLDTETTSNNPALEAYLEKIRRLSLDHTGNEITFETAAGAFIDFSNDGTALKTAIKTIPRYKDSTGAFWEARARMIRDSDASSAFGKQLKPGIEELLVHLDHLGKKMGVISNSRSDLIIPTLTELLPQKDFFSEIVALGGTSTPPKPTSDAYELLRQNNSELAPNNTVYVGNAQEDILFAKNIGTPAILLGAPFGDDYQDVHFVPDATILTRVIKRHTEGAALGIDLENHTEAINSQELARLMTPEQVEAMAISGMKRLWKNNLTQALDAYQSKAWSSEFPSLKSIPDFSNHFGTVMGDIRVNTQPEHPALAAYYTPERVATINSETYSLRGKNYFAAVDPHYETADDRLAAMTAELRIAIITQNHIDRSELAGDDLLAYIAVLDNTKQQAISIFHAVTYNERRTGIPEDSEYLALREQLLNTAIHTTRRFYEACLGRPFSHQIDLEDVDLIMRQIRDYSHDLPLKGFKIQELDHPLKIMLAAQNIAQTPTDTVVGFPSGGTQMAIVTALANELLHERAPGTTNVLTIPLSQHSGTTKEGAKPISDEALLESVKIFADLITDHHVTIVDDNSSTGSTLERGVKAISSLQPVRVRTGVGEIDPQRMLIRARLAATLGDNVLKAVNTQHETFDGVAGIVPVTSTDVQLRKEYAGRVLGLKSNKKE